MIIAEMYHLPVHRQVRDFDALVGCRPLGKILDAGKVSAKEKVPPKICFFMLYISPLP